MRNCSQGCSELVRSVVDRVDHIFCSRERATPTLRAVFRLRASYPELDLRRYRRAFVVDVLGRPCLVTFLLKNEAVE